MNIIFKRITKTYKTEKKQGAIEDKQMQNKQG